MRGKERSRRGLSEEGENGKKSVVSYEKGIGEKGKNKGHYVVELSTEGIGKGKKRRREVRKSEERRR